MSGQANAQAFVGAPNTLDISTSYGFQVTKGEYSGCGEYWKVCLPEDKYTFHTLDLGLEYSTPVEGLALSAGMPLVSAKYGGPYDYGPNPNSGKFFLQDFRANVRYQLPVMPAQFRVTPSIGFLLPVHYPDPYAGHAIWGKNLKELNLGVAVGRGFLEDAMFDLSAQFSVPEGLEAAESTGRQPPKRMDLNLTFGYFITPKLMAQAGAAYKYSFGGGFSLSEYATWDADYNNWTEEQFTMSAYHDQLKEEKALQAKLGLAYEINDTFAVQGEVQRVLRGANFPSATMASLGFSTSFDLNSSSIAAPASMSSEQEDAGAAPATDTQSSTDSQ